MPRHRPAIIIILFIICCRFFEYADVETFSFIKQPPPRHARPRAALSIIRLMPPFRAMPMIFIFTPFSSEPPTPPRMPPGVIFRRGRDAWLITPRYDVRAWFSTRAPPFS